MGTLGFPARDWKRLFWGQRDLTRSQKGACRINRARGACGCAKLFREKMFKCSLGVLAEMGGDCVGASASGYGILTRFNFCVALLIKSFPIFISWLA